MDMELKDEDFDCLMDEDDVDPTIKLKEKIVELEAIKRKFDALMKLVDNQLAGGIYEFTYWRPQHEIDSLINVGFDLELKP
jgi:hypothetical protein